MHYEPCIGVVLAGGKSTRMGKDKASLTIKNCSNDRREFTMLSYSQQLLEQVGINTVVVSGKSSGLKDQIPNIGPLGGIYSAIKAYPAQAMLIIPVDMPLVTINCLARLKQVGELSAKACHYGGEPLPLYLPINAFVEGFFVKHFEHLNSSKIINDRPSNELKGPSIMSLLKEVPTQRLATPKDQSLFNANTPEQWQYAKTQLMRRQNHYA